MAVLVYYGRCTCSQQLRLWALLAKPLRCRGAGCAGWHVCLTRLAHTAAGWQLQREAAAGTGGHLQQPPGEATGLFKQSELRHYNPVHRCARNRVTASLTIT
jgi:hypothetical protein